MIFALNLKSADLRNAVRLPYAAHVMNVLLAVLHLAVMTAKLCGPGGVRAVIAENLGRVIANSRPTTRNCVSVRLAYRLIRRDIQP